MLLHPACILKRKNIELGMRVMAELKAAGKNCCCIVTGAPDPHNPGAVKYHESLLQLRTDLGIADEFIFLSELFTVTNRDLIGLYRVADALFFPSKQEGFGLPILEGALHGIPIFCADIEPMKSLAHHNPSLFQPRISPRRARQPRFKSNLLIARHSGREGRGARLLMEEHLSPAPGTALEKPVTTIMNIAPALKTIDDGNLHSLLSAATAILSPCWGYTWWAAVALVVRAC